MFLRPSAFQLLYIYSANISEIQIPNCRYLYFRYVMPNLLQITLFRPFKLYFGPIDKTTIVDGIHGGHNVHC